MDIVLKVVQVNGDAAGGGSFAVASNIGRMNL